MNKHNLIKELVSIQSKERELKNELMLFLKERAESKREFNDGEIVDIYKRGAFFCRGIIGGAFILSIDDFEFKSMAENESKYLEKINEIRYKVFAMKKDGTASKQNATASKSLSTSDRYSDYYIFKN